MQSILFYGGGWDFLSNFSAYAIYWEGEWWMTTEHAYQAAKFTDVTIRNMIRDARSAHDTKKIARAHVGKMRPDWSDIRLAVMESILRAKLEQHPYVKRKLLASGERNLVENSPEDDFWGRGPGWAGENHLGRLWMKLRDELRAGETS